MNLLNTLEINIKVMSENMNQKSFLLILDGWGIGKDKTADAIFHARTPFIDQLLQKYPSNILITHGKEVGLPEGQMGNSEVGHLNIGAGRIVYQELQRINQSIENNSLKDNPVLKATFQKAITSNKPLHLMGILSDGGVHGHIEHLKKLVTYALEAGVSHVYIHGFTDGRDTDPNFGKRYVSDLNEFLLNKPVTLATLVGRYYAMDRDRRWERVAVAYNALTKGEGKKTNDMLSSLEESYDNEITDEFLKPLIAINEHGDVVGTIGDDDVVISYNFRTDRCREITEVLTQKAIPKKGMEPLKLHYVTMTEYDHDYENIPVIFNSNDLTDTIGEVLEKAGKTQIRIAETEKYPHVTFFFSGGREIPFVGEKRILIPSPSDVPTYDFKPEMGAYEITEAILKAMDDKPADFVCLNFANADMVGHTGKWEAAIKACEVVDECVSKIVPKALEKGYGLFVIADHGNSDFLINEDGSPNTAHTLNDVPFIYIPPNNDHRKYAIKKGKLADIAPTILNFMHIDIPEVMNGSQLIHWE